MCVVPECRARAVQRPDAPDNDRGGGQGHAIGQSQWDEGLFYLDRHRWVKPERFVEGRVCDWEGEGLEGGEGDGVGGLFFLRGMFVLLTRENRIDFSSQLRYRLGVAQQRVQCPRQALRRGVAARAEEIQRRIRDDCRVGECFYQTVYQCAESRALIARRRR